MKNDNIIFKTFPFPVYANIQQKMKNHMKPKTKYIYFLIPLFNE